MKKDTVDGIVAQAFNHSKREAEAGVCLTGTSTIYTDRLYSKISCLQNKTKQKTWGRSPKAPNFKKQEKTTEDTVLRYSTG